MEFDAFIIDVQLVSHEADNDDGIDIAAQSYTRDANASVLILSSWSAQLSQARNFKGKKANVHVADKTKPREVEKAVEAFCRCLRQNTPLPMTYHVE